MSNFEQRFRLYLSYFDGQPKAWSSEIQDAFDAIFHESYYLETDGDEKLTREKLKLIQSNALEAGSASEIIHVEVETRQNGEESSADIKFRMKSSLSDIIVHRNVLLEDGKMFRAKATAKDADELHAMRKEMLNFNQVKEKLLKRAALYDGKPKSFTPDIAKIFDDTYHDDFLFCIDDRKIRKEEIMATAELLMAKPTKATVQACRPIDSTHMELRAHVQLGENLAFEEHLIVTMEGGKLIHTEPYDTAARDELKKATLRIKEYLGSEKMSEFSKELPVLAMSQ